MPWGLPAGSTERAPRLPFASPGCAPADLAAGPKGRFVTHVGATPGRPSGPPALTADPALLSEETPATAERWLWAPVSVSKTLIDEGVHLRLFPSESVLEKLENILKTRWKVAYLELLFR